MKKHKDIFDKDYYKNGIPKKSLFENFSNYIDIGGLVIFGVVVGSFVNEKIKSLRKEADEKDRLLSEKEIEIKNLKDFNEGLVKNLKNSSYQLGKMSSRRKNK